MSRKNEPWYWEARKRWYVTLNGKRIKLSTDKEEAFTEFYRLKAENPALSANSRPLFMSSTLR